MHPSGSIRSDAAPPGTCMVDGEQVPLSPKSRVELEGIDAAQNSMVTIGIGQFRSDTRNYVQRAKAGESFRVLRRGVPVAELLGAQSLNYEECQWVLLTVVRSRAAVILERVSAGETIAITQRGEALAALQPYAVDESRGHAR